MLRISLATPRFRGVLLVLALVAVACGGDGKSPTGTTPVTPALAVITPTVVPGGILAARLQGAALAPGAVTATLGGVALVASRLDDSTVTALVPAVSVGPQPLVVTAAARTLSATVQVAAAPVIGDPDAWLASAIGGSAAIDAIEAELADTVVVRTAADSARVRADVQRLRDSLARVNERLAALTPAERAQVATMVAARLQPLRALDEAATANVLGVAGLRADVVLAGGRMHAINSVCLGTSYSAEDCASAQLRFSDDTAARLTILIGLTAAAFAEGLTGVGIAAGGVTVYIAMKEFKVVERDAQAMSSVPTYGQLLPDGETRALRARDTSTLAAGVRLATREAELEYFTHAVARPFTVRARYRTLVAADQTSGAATPLARVMRRVENAINSIRATFFASPIPPLLPAMPRREVVRAVPPRFLDITTITPSAVTVAAERGETSTNLTFSRAGITGDIPFTFVVRYVPPALLPQERTVSALLIPTPRFIAKTLFPGNGGQHTCALGVDDRVFCWGANAQAQFGIGTTANSNRPLAVRAAGFMSSLSVGNSGMCGIGTTGGIVYCSGAVDRGFVDPSSSYDRLRSTAADGSRAYSEFATGSSAYCGISGGVARCWGILNDSSIRRAPANVAGAAGMVQIAAGSKWACGLDTAGAAWCWGYNRFGGLGHGGGDVSASAVRVAGGRTYSSITMGEDFACALTPEGKAFCWGQNYDGQLGTGTPTTDPMRSPVAAAPSLTFLTLAAGFRQACGVTVAGRIYCWGNNRSGNLGNGTLTSVVVNPTAVSSSAVFEQVVVGSDHGCGMSAAGAVYCWGQNFSGQLGDGTAINNADTPVTVAAPLQ